MSDPNAKRRRVVEDDEDDEDEEPIAADDQMDDRAPSSDEEGEDLLENAEADYERIDELDRYDEEMLDEREYAGMSAGARRAAEDELATRAPAQRDRRLAGILDDFGDDEEDERRQQRRGGRARAAYDDDDDGEEADEEDADEYAGEEINLEGFDVPLREWLANERTRREVKRRFRDFLISFREPAPGAANDDTGAGADKPAVRGGPPLHIERMRAMCAENKATLELSYAHLSAAAPILAIWLADAPKEMIELFDEVANRLVTAPEHFPNYKQILRGDEVHVRVCALPILDQLRDLRHPHLGQLVRVGGVVTRRTGVFPQLLIAHYRCKCGARLGPFRQSAGAEVKPQGCACGATGAGSFKLDTEATVYRNYQKCTIQEAPGSVPPGRVPRHKDVILLADLIDVARPGDEVEVTGVFTHAYDLGLSQRSGFPVFHTLIEANHVAKKEKLGAKAIGATDVDDEDKRAILRLARDPRIFERVVRSLAPSLYGCRQAKTAVAFALFGGVPKDVNNKHRIRGDVNVLLLGDPGTAKSQLLKYAEKIAPRAVYTTGKGTSAVGLTAGVHRDRLTGEWTLEGGALVLADRGLCLIDEFDKMSEQDRTSIHEAMEQQSISVSKAGIVTSLQARCSVIAAANPEGGRYDSSLPFSENVSLTDPILQRFDVLCVLEDKVDPVADEMLASFVVGSHRRARPVRGGDGSRDDDAASGGGAAAAGGGGGGAGVSTGGDDSGGAGGAAASGLGADAPGQPEDGDDELELIPQELLKKYIAYAREHCSPQLARIDQAKVASLYAELRRESARGGGVPIAVRHIESLMRMAEARARMHLREHVRDDDVDVAIRAMLESFISSQKFSTRRSLERGFARYLNAAADYDELLLHALQALARDAQRYAAVRRYGRRAAGRELDDEPLEVHMDDLEARARDFGVHSLDGFYRSRAFRAHRFEVDHKRRMIVKAL